MSGVAVGGAGAGDGEGTGARMELGLLTVDGQCAGDSVVGVGIDY